MKFNVSCKTDSQVFAYAKAELERCLLEMDSDTLFGEGGKQIALAIKNPDTQNDHIDISFNGGAGQICGSNEGAVVIAVYRFLRELGCIWTCPGKDGEHIPKKQLTEKLLTLNISETPSYKHRGVCIEGAVSEEHVLEMLDFIPRVGMNSYFFQFFRPSVFFKRWYSHLWNDCYKPEEKRDLSAEEVDAILDRLTIETARRGIRHHAIGHGWTCVPFGIEGEGWHQVPDEVLPEGYVELTALFDGKRQTFKGVPLNTNLCYSNPKVMEIMSDAVVEYAQAHPTLSVLHLWLADGENNNCECENCKDTIPSDYYVELLNLVDKKLTEKNLNTKIVFLIYVDLLWAPQKNTFINPDRFIIMFAPIKRTYSKTIVQSLKESKEVHTTPYERNKLTFPTSVAENLAYLDDWRKVFKGEGFLFDYHLMWDHQRDPGYMQISKTLFEDMVALDKIGLDGMISCQVSRASFPTGLPLYAMAKGLWDKTASFDDVADEYFEAEFGDKGREVREYLTKVSDLFDPVYIRDEKPAISEENYQKFISIPAFVCEFKRTHPEMSVASENMAWKVLAIHADQIIALSMLFARRARGEERRDMYEMSSRIVGKNEPAISSRVDAWNYTLNLCWRYHVK
ncbi:MAG: DUF4838 domain-containing protein [Clostridia bacterium]|nr:DUF4838 domain-containing protein [Clostridia bacterium]